jgi:hypothetical protein
MLWYRYFLGVHTAAQKEEEKGAVEKQHPQQPVVGRQHFGMAGVRSSLPSLIPFPEQSREEEKEGWREGRGVTKDRKGGRKE